MAELLRAMVVEVIIICTLSITIGNFFKYLIKKIILMFFFNYEPL